MAANPPPAHYRVPSVYRAARTRSWIKRGVVTHLAFYRRDSDTQGLTVGDTVESAERDIAEHFGVIQIESDRVLGVRLASDNPPIRLSITPKEAVADQGNINTSLPFRDDPDPHKAGLAIAIATELAKIAAATDRPPKIKA